MQTSLPAPTASGLLSKTPVPHLLVYALDRHLTGTFELTQGGAALATMLVVGGCPAKIRTSEPVHHLGEVMEELGLISTEQLEASRARMRESGRLQGEILLEMGAVDATTLDAGVRAQLERKIEHLFTLPSDATFTYHDGFDHLERFGGAPTPIDPIPVLWRTLRRAPRWEHVEATLRRVGASLLRLSPGARIDRFAFAPRERETIAALAQRPMCVQDLTEVAGAALGQLLAYVLVITRQVDLVEPAPRPSVPDAPPSSAPTSGALGRPPTGQPFARVQLQRQQTTRGPVIVEEKVAPPSSDARASLDSRSTSPATSGATAEQQALRSKILERAAKIASQNYFEVLGVERDTPPEAVQKAFFTLAKRWHPDRLPPALADVKDACSKVFVHLTEAHATLSDTKKRQDYTALLEEGATPKDHAKIQAIVEAATEFQKAEFLLKRSMTDPKAYAMVRRCVALDPEQADYLALLAWLDAQKPDALGRDKTLEKIGVLDRCLKMKDSCERAYFYRGMLYKRLDEPNKAIKDFKQAAELNPRNLDAIREIRLSTMRGITSDPPPKRSSSRPSKPPPEARAGLLGRLFKK